MIRVALNRQQTRDDTSLDEKSLEEYQTKIQKNKHESEHLLMSPESLSLTKLHSKNLNLIRRQARLSKAQR